MKKKELNDPKAIARAVEKRAKKEETDLAAKGKDGAGDESPYFIHEGYLCRKKPSKDGDITIRLCNFDARIDEEHTIDDGKEKTTNFIIGGKLGGKIPLPKLEIPATAFPSMSWVTRWGSKPILEPGQTVKDFVRHAIQIGSDDVKVLTSYAHTDWRKIEDEMVYLHAGGAIGGPEGVSVKLSRELERYILPPLPLAQTERTEELSKSALEASLSFLDIGSHAVTLPLFCLAYLSPITTILTPLPNFSMYLFGQSGTFKTTAAVLALCHFGDFRGVEEPVAQMPEQSRLCSPIRVGGRPILLCW